MTNSASAPANSDQPSISDLANALETMRVFMTRRFDELSMEVNATGQILGMTEESMVQRFTEVLTVLNAIAFKGDGDTPHNVGVELDAVIKTTEEAANKILDNADNISRIAKSDIDWADEAARAKILSEIDNCADNILSACAFQDLTGQRIGRTLENIRKAEAELADTLKRMGLRIDVDATSAAETLTNPENRASSQADIDALFN